MFGRGFRLTPTLATQIEAERDPTRFDRSKAVTIQLLEEGLEDASIARR
jgi:hypothetical protein